MSTGRGKLLISIVIPAYNYADRLTRAIHSVLEQLDPKKHELIVINDGSTDETEQILSKMKDKANKHFQVINQENAGLAAVRNLGIKKAQGDYLIFLDADDLMLQGALELIEQHIKENPHSELIIGSYISVIEETGKEKTTLPNTLPKSPTGRVKAYLLDKRLSLANGATVMHRSIFENGLYPEHFRCVEDLPVFAQALANNRCTVIKMPLAKIYRHEASLRNDAVLSDQVGMQLVDEIFNRLPAEMHVLYRPFKAQRALSLFRSFYTANLDEQAKVMYILAIKERWLSIFKLSYTRKAFRLFICR